MWQLIKLMIFHQIFKIKKVKNKNKEIKVPGIIWKNGFWGWNKVRISKKKSIHFIKQKLVSIYQKLLSYMFAI